MRWTYHKPKWALSHSYTKGRPLGGFSALILLSKESSTSPALNQSQKISLKNVLFDHYHSLRGRFGDRPYGVNVLANIAIPS